MSLEYGLYRPKLSELGSPRSYVSGSQCEFGRILSVSWAVAGAQISTASLWVVLFNTRLVVIDVVAAGLA